MKNIKRIIRITMVALTMAIASRIFAGEVE